jgi:hypothetical protein
LIERLDSVFGAWTGAILKKTDRIRNLKTPGWWRSGYCSSVEN